MDNYVSKGVEYATVATTQDQAKDYESALANYAKAVDYLMMALKYNKNEQLKQSLRPKVTSYLTRAEDIKKILASGHGDKKPVAEGSNGSSKKGVNGGAKKDDDDESGDPDRKRMMQKFEGAILSSPNVKLDDVIGLVQAKQALNDAVLMPITFPQFFQGKRKPWAGILLYGPPGTGKSYLAKAIATECKSTFISVTSSDLLSKWLGESEKGVRCLFDLARERQPCIVFVDEIDALCGQRSDNESESSRRVKTEFLVQMNGVGSDNSGVLVLAATNIPWSLDTAIRRRFEKRIYIPLPDVESRAMMFKMHLGETAFHSINENEWKQLAVKAENYSGADIASVCREALLRPIRRLGTATHFKQVINPKNTGPRMLWLACSPGDPGAEEKALLSIKPDEVMEPPVTMKDMVAALATQKPTVGPQDLLQQEKFTEQYGQEGS